MEYESIIGSEEGFWCCPECGAPHCDNEYAYEDDFSGWHCRQCGATGGPGEDADWKVLVDPARVAHILRVLADADGLLSEWVHNSTSPSELLWQRTHDHLHKRLMERAEGIRSTGSRGKVEWESVGQTVLEAATNYVRVDPACIRPDYDGGIMVWDGNTAEQLGMVVRDALKAPL